MKYFPITLIIILLSIFCQAQTPPPGKGFEPYERALYGPYLQQVKSLFMADPPQSPVRNPAEWEEMEGVVIAWKSYSDVLIQIVQYAREEGWVYILTQDSNSVKGQLQAAGVSLSGVKFFPIETNSVWIRDYGPNSAYTNDVDSLVFVDWVYNRPRPLDDASPVALAQTLGIPVHEATQMPRKLVATGGNFFSDGFGTAFSSHLITEENPDLSEAEINQIQSDYLGIDTYVKFQTLPYDDIHHLDMHMKLLNEETLLVGEFPTGVADEPQIEANLDYLLSSYSTVFGTPFKIVRIPMVPSSSGNYPDNNAYYRTFTNSLILNKTVLVPTYYEAFDTIGLRIYRENMPGYRVVGINCQETISASGALHCITHEIGTRDPLLISHHPLSDATNPQPGFPVSAHIQHRSGIAQAQVHYRTDTLQPFLTAPLTLSSTGNHMWEGNIPSLPDSSTVEYYISASSTSGKSQVRPMTAPEGHWKFFVAPGPDSYHTPSAENGTIQAWFSKASGQIAVLSDFSGRTGPIEVFDITGKKVQTFAGMSLQKNEVLLLPLSKLPSGIYLLSIGSRSGRYTNKFFVP